MARRDLLQEKIDRVQCSFEKQVSTLWRVSSMRNSMFYVESV